MSPLAKYRSCLATFLGAGLLSTLLALYVHVFFVGLAFVCVIFFSWLLYRPACPECGTSLAPPVGSSFGEIINSFRSGDCRSCGKSLNGS